MLEIRSGLGRVPPWLACKCTLLYDLFPSPFPFFTVCLHACMRPMTGLWSCTYVSDIVPMVCLSSAALCTVAVAGGHAQGDMHMCIHAFTLLGHKAPTALHNGIAVCAIYGSPTCKHAAPHWLLCRFWMTDAQAEVLVEPESFAEARESPLGEVSLWLLSVSSQLVLGRLNVCGPTHDACLRLALLSLDDCTNDGPMPHAHAHAHADVVCLIVLTLQRCCSRCL